MTTRTRRRVDNETLETIGWEQYALHADQYSSLREFPRTGRWEFPEAGLSGYNLADKPADRNAIKSFMYANWRRFAKRRDDRGTAAIGYSQYGHSTITDAPTKNFKKLSASGAIVNNAYSRTKVEFKSALVEDKSLSETPPNVVIDNWTNWSIQFYIHTAWENVFHASLSAPKQVVEFLESYRPPIPGRQTAINNAFGNVQQGEVELLVMAAEGRKTVQHLASVVLRFAKLVRALKTGNFRSISPKVYKKWKEGAYGKAATSADVFADAWMEARYAWVPTVMDAIGAFNILTGNVSNRQTFRGVESEQYIDQIDRLVDCGFANVRLQANVFGNMSCRAGVLTETVIDSPNLKSTGVFNMATAVKEVIPYSFVLEWFVNLSGLLYYLNPNPLLRPLAAWATDSWELQFAGQITWDTPLGRQLSVPIMGRLSAKDRTPIDGPSILTVDVNLGIARILDGAILLLRNLR